MTVVIRKVKKVMKCEASRLRCEVANVLSLTLKVGILIALHRGSCYSIFATEYSFPELGRFHA